MRPDDLQKKQTLFPVILAVGTLFVAFWVARKVVYATLGSDYISPWFDGGFREQLLSLAIAAVAAAAPMLFSIFLFKKIYSFSFIHQELSFSMIGVGFIFLIFPSLLLFLASLIFKIRSLSEILPIGGMPAPIWVPIVVVKIFFLASLEEIFFRGFTLSGIYELTKSSFLSVAISSILFVLVHDKFNIDDGLSRLLMGIGFGWSVIRLKSIWFAIGAHAAINLGVALLFPPFGMDGIVAAGSTATRGATGLEAGHWQAGLTYLVLIVGSVEITRFLFRRKLHSITRADSSAM